MSTSLYTIEQVAEQLQLHVKTVQRYVREGRLKATRIGRQYRISGADLAEFSGGAEDAVTTTAAQRQVEGNSVVDITAISPTDATRLTNTLIAAMQGASGDHTRVDSIYYEETGRLKIIINGTLQNTAELLKMIDTLLQGAR